MSSYNTKLTFSFLLGQITATIQLENFVNCIRSCPKDTVYLPQISPAYFYKSANR